MFDCLLTNTPLYFASKSSIEGIFTSQPTTSPNASTVMSIIVWPMSPTKSITSPIKLKSPIMRGPTLDHALYWERTESPCLRKNGFFDCCCWFYGLTFSQNRPSD